MAEVVPDAPVPEVVKDHPAMCLGEVEVAAME